MHLRLDGGFNPVQKYICSPNWTISPHCHCRTSSSKCSLAASSALAPENLSFFKKSATDAIPFWQDMAFGSSHTLPTKMMVPKGISYSRLPFSGFHVNLWESIFHQHFTTESATLLFTKLYTTKQHYLNLALIDLTDSDHSNPLGWSFKLPISG